MGLVLAAPPGPNRRFADPHGGEAGACLAHGGPRPTRPPPPRVLTPGRDLPRMRLGPHFGVSVSNRASGLCFRPRRFLRLCRWSASPRPAPFCLLAGRRPVPSRLLRVPPSSSPPPRVLRFPQTRLLFCTGPPAAAAPVCGVARAAFSSVKFSFFWGVGLRKGGGFGGTGGNGDNCTRKAI